MGHGVDGCEVGVRGGEVRDGERGATDELCGLSFHANSSSLTIKANNCSQCQQARASCANHYDYLKRFRTWMVRIPSKIKDFRSKNLEKAKFFFIICVCLTCVHIHVRMHDDHRDHNVADNGNVTMRMITYPCTYIHVVPAERELGLPVHRKVILQPSTAK